MNIRTAGWSIISFVILLLILSFATDRGNDKVIPKLEESQNRIAEQSDLLKNLIARDMEDMGVASGSSEGSINEILEEMLGGTDLKSIINPPVGTWIGVRKSHTSQTAYIKFDKNEYWLKTKDDNNRDVLEHGKFEYGIVEIYFQPEGQRAYNMQYEMISPEYIQLFGREVSYDLEKSEDIAFNF